MMAPVDPHESTVVQTGEAPMTGLDSVKDHAEAMRALVTWDWAGVLMDEGQQAVVTVLLEGDEIVAASGFCLSADQSADTLRESKEGSVDLIEATELRCWQGHAMTREQMCTLSEWLN